MSNEMDTKIKETFKPIIDSTYLALKKHNPKLKKKTIATQIIATVRAKAFWDAKQEVKAGIK